MKRTKKSQKKTKFLLILIVLTAILSITATYAWFSTQKDVEISTLRLNIEVAESLEISLNGKEWTNKITISDMRQLYGVAEATGLHQASKYDATDEGTKTKTGNTNYIPTKLLPVSTVGGLDNGKLLFMTADSFSGNELKAIACSETDLLTSATIREREANNEKHPYLVFDMYLKNLSAKSAGDALILNTESRVWADNTTTDTYAGASTANTGAENAMRVGFVQYAGTKEANLATETGYEVRTISSAEVVTGDNGTPEDPSDDPKRTTKVAIWEPNDLEHIQEVVNNNSRVTSASMNVTTYGVVYKSTAVGADTAVAVETNAGAAAEGITAEQQTMKPQYNVADVVDGDGHVTSKAGTKVEMPLITSGTTSGNAGSGVTGDIILPQNTISKFRVYVWLEGQDVDCINTASMAGKLDINLRFKKEGSNSDTNITYDPTPVGG